MLERTHARIARRIAQELNLSKEHGDLLESGSVRPDSYIAFPHHEGKDILIYADILDARALLLNNDDEAFVKLGEALHFIADKWTLKPRIDIKHLQYESDIESKDIQDNNQFIKEIQQSIIPSKSKEYYESLSYVTSGLISKNPYPEKKKFMLLFATAFGQKLIDDQRGFLEKYCSDYTNELLSDLEENFNDNKNFDISKFIPFELISQIAWIKRENTVAENYSTPAIDLNVSFRLCLAVCYFVLSKDDAFEIPKKSGMDWNKLSVNWSWDLERIITKAHLKKTERVEEISTEEFEPAKNNTIQVIPRLGYSKDKIANGVFDPNDCQPHPQLWTLTIVLSLLGVSLFLINVVVLRLYGMFWSFSSAAYVILMLGFFGYFLFAVLLNRLLEKKGYAVFYRSMLLNLTAVVLFILGIVFYPF
jgi:hypothetical protein